MFDNVFDKMVAAAQPIPGFRRVKGGEILYLNSLAYFYCRTTILCCG